MSELKACPFCGKDDELYSIPRFLEITKEETKEIEWTVGCKRCDVHLYRARYAKDDGIATWNARPIEDALASRDDLIKRLVEVLPTLKIKHRYCEDCWYSCPKHEDGCCNEAEGEDCNCGADEHNSKIDALMKEME